MKKEERNAMQKLTGFFIISFTRACARVGNVLERGEERFAVQVYKGNVHRPECAGFFSSLFD